MKKLIVFFSLMILFLNVTAQIEISNGINEIYTINKISPLYINDSLIGYSKLILNQDKSTKNGYYYNHTILDLNLKEISSFEIKRDKVVILEEVAYNGKSICMLFSHNYFTTGGTSSKSVEISFFNLDGSIINEESRELISGFNSIGNRRMNISVLSAIKNTGFAIYLPKDLKQSQEYKYNVELYKNDGSLVNTIKKGTLFKTIDNYVFILASQMGGNFDGTVSSEVIIEAYELNETSPKFEIRLDSSKCYKNIVNLTFNASDNTFQLYGEQRLWDSKKKKKKTSFATTNNFNVFISKISLKGEILNTVIIPNNLYQDNLKITEDIKSTDFMSLLSIQKSNDLHIIYSTSYSRIEEQIDITVIRLNEDFSLKDSKKATVCTKCSTPFYLNTYKAPQTVDLDPITFVDWGNKNQAFSSTSSGYYTDNLLDLRPINFNDSNSNLIYFTQNKKNKPDNFVFSLDVIGQVDGSIKISKKDFQMEGDYYQILPAKPGYVGIFLFDKEKAICDFKLEKIDFQ